MKNLKHHSLLAVLISSLLITACSDDNDKNRIISYDNAAIINSTFTGDADLEFVDLDATLLNAAGSNHNTGNSDYTVTTYGEYFYHIGRNNIDTVAKYSIRNPAKKIWQYSTLDDVDDSTSNPYNLIFVDDQKAFLIRYGSDKLWVVNPSAETEEDFKTGEIDLSDYNYPTVGDAPNMAAGIIIGDKLYLAMERLNGWSPVAGESYIAVIDVNTLTEIDTRAPESTATLKGIQLQTANPQKLVYHADAGLFVQSIGTWSGTDAADYIGGVEKIDTSNYSTRYVIDDDSTTQRISNLAVINNSKAYVVVYSGWGNNSLHSVDLSTGDIDTAVADFSGVDIRGLSVDEDGRLWVSINANVPRVDLLDTGTDTISATILTTYTPGKVVFAKIED